MNNTSQILHSASQVLTELQKQLNKLSNGRQTASTTLIQGLKKQGTTPTLDWVVKPLTRQNTEPPAIPPTVLEKPKSVKRVYEALKTIRDKRAEAEKQFNALSVKSPEEIALEKKIKEEQLALRKAQSDLEGQGRGIPLSVIRGQQAKLYEQGQLGIQTDLAKLNSLEQARINEAKLAGLNLNNLSAKEKAILDERATARKTLGDVLDMNTGRTLEEIQKQDPETYQNIVDLTSRTGLTLGDVKHALESSIQSPEVTGFKDKVLSISDAKALGVPIGTRLSEVQGMRVPKNTTIVDKLIDGLLGKTQKIDINNLADDYRSESSEYFKVRDAYLRVVQSAKDHSAAGDLALIFNYMKVLDPGSVVREGEFATAQNAASVPERIRAKYNQVLNGERLSARQRQDFVDRATKLYHGMELTQNRVYNRYKKRAKDYGVDISYIADPITLPKEVKQTVNEIKKQSNSEGGFFDTIKSWFGFGSKKKSLSSFNFK